MQFTSKTPVTVGSVIKAFGRQYRVTVVHDMSEFMKTPYYFVDTTEMLLKDYIR